MVLLSDLQARVWDAVEGNDATLLRRLQLLRIPMTLKKEKDSSTPLHRAASLGRVQCIEVLLEDAQVNVNARDSAGNTPLHWAADVRLRVCVCAWACVRACVRTHANFPHVQAGRNDAIAMLLESGARIGDVNAAGEGAVHLAARCARACVPGTCASDARTRARAQRRVCRHVAFPGVARRQSGAHRQHGPHGPARRHPRRPHAHCR